MLKNIQSTFALPLDIFRIAVGCLGLIYFLRIMYDAPYFLEQQGLINHELVRDIFWYTWQPLFHPAMSDGAVYFILGVGTVFSTLLIMGFKSRPIAFVLYFIVVCIYRYQFLVLFVDDVIMHLLLFWCFVLPTGKTLTIKEWMKDKKIVEEWKNQKVDGFTVKLLLFNIALIYFVAGVSKYTSTLWMNGTALYAVLKLPLGWFSDYPLENFKMLLQGGNYLALLFEPLFVLLVILKPWNKFKLFLGLSFIIFHTTIILTLDISIANIGCLLLTPIIFRHEIMDVIRKNKSLEKRSEVPINKFGNCLATLMIFFLTGAMALALTQDQWRQAKRVTGKDATAKVVQSSADSGGKIQTFFYGGLWAMGLAQGYRLLDWIDERNFHQKITVIEEESGLKKEFDRLSLVPIGMRGSLILSFISEVTWMYVDPKRIDELRSDIRLRMKAIYCRHLETKTNVNVWHVIGRVDSFTPKLNAPEILLSFSCENFKPLDVKN